MNKTESDEHVNSGPLTGTMKRLLGSRKLNKPSQDFGAENEPDPLSHEWKETNTVLRRLDSGRAGDPSSSGPMYVSSHSGDIILSDVRPLKLEPDTLRCINVFLDDFLHNVLSLAGSFSTGRLRASLLGLLPTSLGKKALVEAEVEIRAYWERMAPTGIMPVLEDDSATFHLPWAFELLRNKCEAYSTLNEVDEDPVAEASINRRYNGQAPPPLPLLLAPAALYLTEILEVVCEHVLENVSRVTRDSSRNSATTSDLFTALREDALVYGYFKTTKVYNQIEQLSRAPSGPQLRRSRTFSWTDKTTISSYHHRKQKKGSETNGFRALWLRVKPAEKSDEGVPFDPKGAMFGLTSAGASAHDKDATVPDVALGEASSLPAGNFAPRHKPTGTRNRIIPHEEDTHCLHQECKVAVVNATLLSEALLTYTPSSRKSNPIIKEFHTECENQQKLVCAQIPWATARAEQSRVERNTQRGEGHDDETNEEKLLGALLGANEGLSSALAQYNDLFENLVEKKSRKDDRIDRREPTQHQLQPQTEHLGVTQDIGASRSRAPSPAGSASGSPAPNGSAPSLVGHGSDTSPVRFYAYQGARRVGGTYAYHQGRFTYASQPRIQQQQVTVDNNAIQSFHTIQSDGQTYTNKYRSFLEHDASLLHPPPSAPYGPHPPRNFSIRFRKPYLHGNGWPGKFSNNVQHSPAGGDHHGIASVIVLTHNETDGGSYVDAHNGQQQSAVSSPLPLDTQNEPIKSGRTTAVLTDQLPEVITATTASASVCLYPSGIAGLPFESYQDQCLYPTGDRDLDRFFGLSPSPSVVEEASHLPDQSEVSDKVVAVFKEASRIEISGSVFNNAGNDIHNHQTDQQVHYYSTPLPPSPQQKKGPGGESTHVWSKALLYVVVGFAIGIIPTAILKWVGRSWC